MVRVLKTVFAVWMMMLFTAAAAGAVVVDRIVAVVNDEVVTLSELNRAFESFARKIEADYKGDNKEGFLKHNKELFLRRIVDQILIEQEAKKAGKGFATIKDEEVMVVLNDMLARNQVSMDDYIRKLAAEGSSLEAIKKEIRDQMLRMRLLRQEVQSKIVVTDEEIGEYYNKHRTEYEGKEALRLKQILIPAGADKASREAASTLARQIHERLVKGESFDALAAQYSKGPAAAQGGDIGFVERGVIIPAVEKSVFGLSVGQLSEVIESEIGFHILAVTDRRGAGVKPLPAVRNEIKAKIEEEKIAKKYDEWIEGLRKKSFVDIRL